MKAILDEIIALDPDFAAGVGPVTDALLADLRDIPAVDQAALHAAIRSLFRERYGREMIAPVVNRIGLALRTAAAVS